MEKLYSLPAEWAVLALAALPVIELRGAIPVGIYLGLGPGQTYLLAVLGSMFPVPFLLLFFGPACYRLRRFVRLRPWVDRFMAGARGKGALHRYGVLGLILFVSVPLPYTGAWTGAMAASLLGLRFWPALWAIAVGCAVAGFIVTLMSLLGKISIDYFL